MCVCDGQEAEACESVRKRKCARDTSDSCLLLFADTTRGNQRKTSLTPASWSRFNTGERDVDFGRGRAASSSAITIYGHGRRGAPVTEPPPHSPLDCLLGKAWGCGSENS